MLIHLLHEHNISTKICIHSTRLGHVTKAQCGNAMASMGIPESCRVDAIEATGLEGDEEDAVISKQVFINCAKIGLAKATSTFMN